MRAVFFVQGTDVPAARVRGFAVARALEARGVTVSVRVPRPSVYGDTRLPWPLNRPRPLYVPFGALARLPQMSDLRSDDVVIFQRPMTELPTTLFERWAARGRRSIFDFDDAIYERRGVRGKFRRIVALADRVVAGNRHLAAAAEAPAKTVVIPTAIDTDRFVAQPTRPARGRDVVVGWTGLSGNYRQLTHAAAGIARALERTGARFLAISDRPPPKSLAALRPEFVPWRADSEVADLARIDIGVMPLPDDAYARGKCAFKLLQYMALARPGVGSPVGANADVVSDGDNGFLPADDDGWDAALTRLIEDPAERQRVGTAGRARVEAAYSLAYVADRYKALIEEVSAA